MKKSKLILPTILTLSAIVGCKNSKVSEVIEKESVEVVSSDVQSLSEYESSEITSSEEISSEESSVPVLNSISLNIGDYGDANNWTDGTNHTTIEYGILTLSALKNDSGQYTGNYYRKDESKNRLSSTWRFYASESGCLSISLSKGNTINSITLTVDETKGSFDGYPTNQEVFIENNPSEVKIYAQGTHARLEEINITYYENSSYEPETSESVSSEEEIISEINSNESVSEDSFQTSDFSYDGDYYNSIDMSLTGTSLLSQLQDLNAKERTFTPGYSSLWQYYKYTDYDPNDSSKYIAFYQGTSASQSEMNKEHVWPKSRGGNLVEGDLHMTRPTLSSDNSSRGNSFYVEGKNSTSDGWDPYASGMNEKYRGIAARIIFYCCVANNQLSLVDEENDATSNKTMGKLSDLLKWNLLYDIDDSEIRRNNGVQEIQGNRNPFIDNRSLACAIWGNTNDETQKICSGVLSSTSYNINDSFYSVFINNSMKIDLYDSRKYIF